ncbi:MAG: STAS domain-containing protein [Planctomycetota bacterium]
MKLTHEDRDELTVLTLDGELSRDEPERFRRAVLERLDARARDFVLDLGGLDAIDSQGLESLLWLEEQCADRLGQVRLARCNDTLRNVLRVTRLTDHFPAHDDVDAAIRSLGTS